MSKKYSISKLDTSFWLDHSGPVTSRFVNDQKFIQEYRKIGYWKWMIYGQIKKIDLLLERRTSYINQHREFSDQLSHDLFEKKLSKLQKDNLNDKIIHLFQLIELDTEMYFVHAKLLLDKLIPIIKYLDKSIPSKLKNNFTSLFEHIIKNNSDDKELEDFIRNSKWFILMIRSSRNNIFVHDFNTNDSGGGDHLDDFGITKSTELRNEQKYFDKIKRIKNKHKNKLPQIENGNEKILFQVIRLLDHNSKLLTIEEIKEIEHIHSKIGGMFPYVKEVNPKIQELLFFIEKWVYKKISKTQFGIDLL